jgi:hypothetical protein
LGNPFHPVQELDNYRGKCLYVNKINNAPNVPSDSGIPLAKRGGEQIEEQYTGWYVMKVKFVLTMDDVEVDDQKIDQVILDWETDVNQDEILELSHKWITSKNFLTRRMEGLRRVGESSLMIEPLEEDVEDAW